MHTKAPAAVAAKAEERGGAGDTSHRIGVLQWWYWGYQSYGRGTAVVVMVSCIFMVC